METENKTLGEGGNADDPFAKMESPDYPATCDQCGTEGTNASLATHGLHECRARQDLKRYHKLLVANNVDAMIAIEKRYDLYGYPPSVVMQGIGMVARGEDMYEGLDRLMGLDNQYQT